MERKIFTKGNPSAFPGEGRLVHHGRRRREAATGPVWFLWDSGTILIYSKPDARKVHHIAGSPDVAFALNTDKDGDEVTVFTGRAAIDPGAPSAHRNPAYLRRYRKGITALSMTPEKMALEYSTAIGITPESLWGW